MNVNTEDITVAWGQTPHQLDHTFGRWRMAIFQDTQESLDQTKLYFLYDPVCEQEAGGQPKGNQSCLVIFDCNLKCFAHEIPLTQAHGRVKFLFSLKCPSAQNGSSFVLVTEGNVNGGIYLYFYRLDLTQDGLNVATCRPLTTSPLSIGGEFIVSMREDAPEVVVMANPGLQIWQIDCMADQPQPPMANFTIPGAELTHFYDGFLNNGRVYLLSASPDGHLDYSRVHVLQLSTQGPINTHNCRPDPGRGFPPHRKQAAIDSVPGYIMVAGGEVIQDDDVHRLVDYWVLDCEAFQWTQVPSQMPCPLIEPRLTACGSGTVYLWGDFDQPLPGMAPGTTHLRIMKISGLAAYKKPPPSYDESLQHPTPYPNLNAGSPQQPPVYPSYQPSSGPAQPAYPGSSPYPDSNSPSQPPSYPSYQPSSGPAQPPYPGANQYPSAQGGGYPGSSFNPQAYNPQGEQGGYPQGSYPQPDQGGGPQSSGPGYSQPQAYTQEYDAGGQHAYYPPKNKKDKKDCVVM